MAQAKKKTTTKKSKKKKSTTKLELPKVRNFKLLVSLASIFLILSLTYLLKGKGDQVYYEEQFPDFSVNKEKVEKITLEKEDKKIELSKEGENWKVEKEIFAEQGKIDRILNAFEEVQIKELISEKKEKHEKFEISDEKAKKIDFSLGDKFLVGKVASGGVFIRREGDPRVFLADNISLSYSFDLETDFRDKKIVRFEVDEVGEFNFFKGEEGISFKKEGDKWQVEAEDFSTDDKKVSDFLGKIIALKADDFLVKEEVADYDFMQPEFAFNLKIGSEEKSLSFVLKKEEEKEGSEEEEKENTEEESEVKEEEKIYYLSLSTNAETFYSIKGEKLSELQVTLEDFRAVEEEKEGEEKKEE